MIRVIARDSAVGFFGVFATLGLGFASKILLAHLLTVNDFGLLLTGQAIVALALVVAQLSLPDAVVRFVGRYAAHDPVRAKGSLISALQISALGSMAVTVGLVLSAGWIANRLYRQAALAGVLIFLAAAIPFTTIADLLAASFRGLGQLWVKVVCVDLARALWTVLILLVLIGWLGRGVSPTWVAAIGFGLAAVLSAVLTAGLFWRSKQWRLTSFRISRGELLHYSLPLLAAGLLAGPIASTGLPLLLGSLASVQAVAYYSVAVSFQPFVYLPISVLEQAALPIWSGQVEGKAISELRSSYAFFTRWGYLMASVVFVLLFFNVRPLLSLLYGPTYEVAAPAFQSFAAVALFSASVGPNEGMLRAIGDTRNIFWARLIASLTSFVTALWLIPKWGLMGGVVALIIAGALTNGVYAVNLSWQHNIHPLNVPYSKALIASFMAFVSVDLALPYFSQGAMRFGGSVLLYITLLVVLLFAFRAFTTQDLRMMASAYQQVTNWFSRKQGSETIG